MKKISLFLIILVFTSINCQRVYAEELSLTLDEAIDIALRDNRDIMLKAEDIKKAKQKVEEARAGFFPTVNVTASRTYTREYYPKDFSQTTTQSTLKQYLYKGGKTINTMAQKKYDLQASEALLDKTELEVILDVKKAFYTLMLAEEFLNLNKSILENAKGHLDVMTARYNNGEASESDILKIKESLSSTEDAWEASLNQVESCHALLRNLLYLSDDVKIKPSGEFIYEPKEMAYDEAFLRAVARRPEIKQYEAQENADKKAIEAAKADSRPNIYASWDYYSRSHAAAGTTKGWSDYNIIGITFTWPVFDGWLTKAKVEQAITDLKETQLTKEKVIKDIALETKTAYLDLKNAISKIKSAEAEVSLYKDQFSVTEEKYKAGIASSLDLSDASLGYMVSMFNKKEAIYDYILAKEQFDKAMGG